MKFILGQKIEMTQVFAPDGAMIPVTTVKAGPSLVIQKKTVAVDGYDALVVAYLETKNVTKPLLKMFKKVSPKTYRFIREFRFPIGDDTFNKVTVGDFLYAENFTNEDAVSVIGVSKGKGFQGVVKRHGFSGGPASHGHKDQLRMPGSVGATGPAHVFNGTKMGGHMGDQQVTVTGLKVMDVDVEAGILYIKGAIPGPRNGLLQMVADGELEVIKKDVAKPIVESKVEVSAAAAKSETSEAPIEDKPVEEKKPEIKKEQPAETPVKKTEDPKQSHKEEEKK